MKLDNFQRVGIVTLTILVIAAVLSADNWPHWRGPRATGASTEKGLPVSWSPTPENVAWKLPMPSRSGATPIIWSDTSFSTSPTADRPGILELWASIAQAGDVLWKKPLGGRNSSPQAEHVVAVAGDRRQQVWVLTGTGS